MARASAVATGTRRQYLRAYSVFEAWLAEVHGLPVEAVASSPERLDSFCAAYVSDLCEEYGGQMKHLAKNLCHGIFLQLGERLRGRLPELARVTLAWDRLYPGSSHQPIPLSWMFLISITLASRGLLRPAIAVQVAFDSFLRVSELLALTPEDVLLASDPRWAPSSSAGVGSSRTHRNLGGLRLRRTKTGANQFAPIRDPVVARYLSWLCACTPAGTLLFPFSPPTFNEHLARSCADLRLPRFTAHCFRHGAACAAAQDGVEPERIRRWGRWRVPRSMDTYLQQVQALVLAHATPPHLLPFIRVAFLWRAHLESLGGPFLVPGGPGELC